jgi:hypothetical protein
MLALTGNITATPGGNSTNDSTIKISDEITNHTKSDNTSPNLGKRRIIEPAKAIQITFNYVFTERTMDNR